MEDVTGGDVCFGLFDGGEVGFFGCAVLDFELGGSFGALDVGEGAREGALEFVEALDGLFVGLGGSGFGDVGGFDEPDLFADVVEGEDFVEEEEAGIGYSQLVGGEGWEALDESDGVIGEEADCAGGEWGQTL